MQANLSQYVKASVCNAACSIHVLYIKKLSHTCTDACIHVPMYCTYVLYTYTYMYVSTHTVYMYLHMLHDMLILHILYECTVP